ncbi:ABC-ATPase domain-containing protein [Salipaludibacillus aurantiacus]|uniref:Predicted ATPase of the ABC class n=1 Tax=Salipaludibacillus aurantiacus TaxID=1601833 RepID=A0A1H9NYQ4_9BACI|nr:ABC-ATPase domain-containing protein [Salipaludibacillus aurantiacus]SER41080.1 Predicted ATPase of the ABC class [Salipaludibacillus aurantiacus]
MKKLADNLKKLDGKSYRALKSIQGTYKGGFYHLYLDYVQGDPFAAPSRLRFFVPEKHTDFKTGQFNNKVRETAFKHFFAKECQKQIFKTKNPVHGTGKSGMIFIDSPGQEMIDRTAVKITEQGIEFRLSAGLPAQGRRILGHKAADLLTDAIPEIIKKTINQYDRKSLEEILLLADDQEFIRHELKTRGLIAFIANDSILPRQSGVSNKPLNNEKVIPFKSPEDSEVSFNLPSGNTVSGMGIKKGITLVIGGGYHGKSTLLQAVERGVYNHETGDGREYVLTDESAVKIRSEDGRYVGNVNISPFINDLPFGKQTTDFSSEDASGSTSQAANIMEALEMNTKLLLIDEDTSATNFMIRDGRMQRLVKKDKEPITPFIDRVRDLYEKKDVSTILVIGGSGDYFDVADYIVMMDEYRPYNKTSEAKSLAEEMITNRTKEVSAFVNTEQQRDLHRREIEKLFDKKEKVESKGLHTIRIGKSNLALNDVEQLVDSSQTQAVALMIKKIVKDRNGSRELKKAIDDLYEQIEKHGLDILSPFQNQHPGDFALPRKFEVAAGFNRIRK